MGILAQVLLECVGELGEKGWIGEELKALGHAVLEEDEKVSAAVV